MGWKILCQHHGEAPAAAAVPAGTSATAPERPAQPGVATPPVGVRPRARIAEVSAQLAVQAERVERAAPTAGAIRLRDQGQGDLLPAGHGRQRTRAQPRRGPPPPIGRIATTISAVRVTTDPVVHRETAGASVRMGLRRARGHPAALGRVVPDVTPGPTGRLDLIVPRDLIDLRAAARRRAGQVSGPMSAGTNRSRSRSPDFHRCLKTPM
jgi:hypothetical protein